MPKFRVQAPDGKTFDVEGPEGATAEQALAHIKASYDVVNDPITKGAEAVQSASPAELIAGSGPGRFALGAAALPLGAAQLAAHAVGMPEAVDRTIKETDDLKRRGMEAYGDKGFDAAGLAGTVMGPGVFGLAKALPAATTALGRAGVGATIGATTGAATPVEDTTDFARKKAVQTALGTAAGAAIPGVAGLVGKALSLGHGAIEHWLPGGTEAILKRGREKLLGDSPDTKSKIIAALEDAQPLVPGSRPTAGEAISHIPEATGLAAHEKFISRQPGVSTEFAARNAEQEAAQQAATGKIDRYKEIIAGLDEQNPSIPMIQAKQAAAEQGLTADTSRRAAFDALAKQTSVGREGQAVATGYLPHVSWTARIIDALRRTGTRSANEQINKLAADQYLNPEKLAVALKDVPISERTKLVQSLMQRSGATDLLPAAIPALTSGVPAALTPQFQPH